MGVAVDQGGETEFARFVRPKEKAGVVKTDPLDGRDVVRLVGGDIDQERVDEIAFFGVSKGFVFLLPAGVLRTLPTPHDDGRLAIGRPTGELRRVVGFLGQIGGHGTPTGSIRGDDIGAKCPHVGMPAPRQIGSQFGVTDQGRFGAGGPRGGERRH